LVVLGYWYLLGYSHAMDYIKIKGARAHNLKNISVDIPKNKLVVFTGLSGSGKSSLAFDTIYAEGQRRYVESLSSYARQFLGVMDKPDVDAIDGLSPAISIDQKTASHNPRSTVGTVTEIYDYLRLLFARIGHPHCPVCGTEITRLSPGQITDLMIKKFESALSENKIKSIRCIVFSPVVRDRKGEFSALFENLRAKGFTSVRIDDHFFDLSSDIVLIKTNKHTINVQVDRLSVDKTLLRNAPRFREFKTRLSEAVEQATKISDGLVVASQVLDASFEFPKSPKKLDDHLYSIRFACPACNISLPEIEPRIFSFNSPHGACENCHGLGIVLRIDPQSIIKDNLSISEGGILPFARTILSDTWFGRTLLTAARVLGIDAQKPLKFAPMQKLEKLLYGMADTVLAVEGENRFGRLTQIQERFNGVIPELERRYSQTESEYVRAEIGKYMLDQVCPQCSGKRLNKQALSIVLDNKSIIDITQMPIDATLDWIVELETTLTVRDKTIANLLLKEIKNRLRFLISVGLTYLTLSRTANTLAGGEAQRIRLASQIGSGLTGVLYVLDEPSIGLHARDNGKLIDTLYHLRNLGNSVIVVEHDREMMESADFILDFGPGAGEHGGQIIAKGTLSDIKKDKASLTGSFLAHRKTITAQAPTMVSDFEKHATLELAGCSGNNLKNISVSFPLEKFICVTGVSGSGKSTLVVDTLFQALAHHFNPLHRERIAPLAKVVGESNLKRVILIDQSPIGRTPRSNPATYTGAFSYIRDLFAQTPKARARGYSPGRFSFNVSGGRCEACEGEGEVKIEMQFLPDVYVTCDVCAGTRFNAETLDIDFKGKNISQILAMTVEEGVSFFANIPGLLNKLETLYSVGLSYIRLGQPAPHLSGGEAQRVKLATELAKRGSRNTLYILDEPTTGLHFADLEKLLYVLRQLVSMGNTVIVIEHNLDVIRNSDWIIDLGPEGGDAGGEIIAQGSPKDVAQVDKSYTGAYLAKNFK